ncbi:hypothetical protein D3C86_1618820 [compost metagenome]
MYQGLSQNSIFHGICPPFTVFHIFDHRIEGIDAIVNGIPVVICSCTYIKRLTPGIDRHLDHIIFNVSLQHRGCKINVIITQRRRLAKCDLEHVNIVHQHAVIIGILNDPLSLYRHIFYIFSAGQQTYR